MDKVKMAALLMAIREDTRFVADVMNEKRPDGIDFDCIDAHLLCVFDALQKAMKVSSDGRRAEDKQIVDRFLKQLPVF